QRKQRRLTLPILGIGGGHSLGEQGADTMKLAADDVQTLGIPGCAHYPAEETPEETPAPPTPLFGPHRDGTARGAQAQAAGSRVPARPPSPWPPSGSGHHDHDEQHAIVPGGRPGAIRW